MEQFKQLALSWFRAAAAAVVAIYMTGETNPKTLAAAALAGVLSATAEVISDQAEIAEDSPADIQHEDLEDWQDQRKKAIAELRNLDDTQPLLIGGSILRDAEKITEILSD